MIKEAVEGGTLISSKIAVCVYVCMYLYVCMCVCMGI